jgi:hypothetical protein
MTLRDQVLAMAGRSKLGDGFDAVVKMLPEKRQAAVRSRLEELRGVSGEALPERLLGLREREARRIGRIGRARYGAGWNRLDPAVAGWLVRNGRKQNH